VLAVPLAFESFRRQSCQQVSPSSGAFLKADDGDRTRDPQLGKLMLYQLSYVREAGSV
jgi:hypothetical protein